MGNEIVLLICEAMLVYLLVLWAHSLRHRFGQVHFYALIGGLTAVMSWVTDAGVAVQAGGITFVVGSTVFYTSLILAVFVVYVFDGPRATRTVILTVAGVSALVPIIAATIHLQMELIGISRIASVPMPSLRINSASVLTTLIDLLFLAMAWEFFGKPKLHLKLWLQAFLTLLGVMWLDVILFATGAFAGTPAYLDIMQGTLLSRLVITVFAFPFLCIYLYWQNRKTGYAIENRPVLTILKQVAEIEHELVHARDEIEFHKKIEEELKLNEARLEALLSLHEKHEFKLDELAKFVLEESARLTQSEVGFINFLSEDEQFVTQAVYTRQTREQCSLPDDLKAFRISDCGLWSEACRRRQAVIVNNYALNQSGKKGLPAGHLVLQRFLSIPVIEGQRIVAVAALGNKGSDYNDGDLRQFRLFLEGLWNIIQRKRFVQKIQSQAEFLNDLFSSTPNLLAIVDVHCRIEKINQKVVHFLGAQTEDIVGRLGCEVFHCLKAFDGQGCGFDLECGHCALLESVKTTFEQGEVVHEREVQMNCLFEGQEVLLHFLISTALIQVEGVKKVLLSMTDITEFKKAEAEKEILKTKLFQAQKMEAIGTLAGGIAHDFNNILASVIGFTDLALYETSKGTKLYEHLSQVLLAGNRARSLVDQILAVARREDQSKYPIQINPLIKETLKMLRSTMPSYIQFKEIIQDQPFVVQANPTQIHQLIMNLATNGMQSMLDQEGILEISLDSFKSEASPEHKQFELPPGEYARLRVSDTGIGVADTDLGKIFEPYFTTKEIGQGNGLGLSVVHGIVKSHKGHIQVSSELGRGSTFQVFLPLSRAKALDEQKKTAEPLEKGAERILLVDDELAIVDMQQQALERLGYTVLAMTSSRKALEALRASPQQFDLLITDMTMPEMTGDKLAAAAKEVRLNMPVILCTGFNERVESDRDRSGVDGFLMKPVDQAELAKTIRKVLNVGKA